jgi:hypothetical protein
MDKAIDYRVIYNESLIKQKQSWIIFFLKLYFSIGELHWVGVLELSKCGLL